MAYYGYHSPLYTGEVVYLADKLVEGNQLVSLCQRFNSKMTQHTGVNRMILCHVLGMPPENLFRIKQDYACLNKIDCRKKPYQVDVMNFRLTS